MLTHQFPEAVHLALALVVRFVALTTSRRRLSIHEVTGSSQPIIRFSFMLHKDEVTVRDIASLNANCAKTLMGTHVGFSC